MAIRNKPKAITKPEIDISGPDGNAFVLLGYAKSYAKDLDLDFSEIHREMMAGDYENLLLVFDKHFGKYVDLIR